ncbi:MAG: DUF4139 domain-containing protein [Sulfurospirillum sp.]|nr:DUF4139 domain-containing protein [Sulfurospirillum sp.]
MKSIFIFFALTLISLFASQTLEIYTNKAFLSKTFLLQKEGKIELATPKYTTLEDISFKLESTCTLGDIQLGTKAEVRDEYSLHVEQLQAQKNTLTSQIKALHAQEELLKTLSLQAQFDIKKIETITEYLGANLIKNQSKIDAFVQKLREVEEQLQELQAHKKEIKSLQVNYTCKDFNKHLTIIYEQKEITFEPFYELYADQKQGTIHLQYKAKISQNSLTDLNNSNIFIYSYAINNQVNPQVFYPHYIYKQQPITYKEKALTSRAMVANEAINAQAETIELQELGSKYVYKLTNVSLPLQKKVIFDIDSQIMPAKFSTYIDAYGTDQAFMQATFKANKEYQNAPAKLYLNTMPIAQNQNFSIKKEQAATLYFGLNQFLHVDKKLIQTDMKKTFFADNEIDTKKWHYTISNVSKNALHVNFVHRVPVSKDANITVKTLAEPLYTSQNAEGRTHWEFALKPDETKEIIFGYEIIKKGKN